MSLINDALKQAAQVPPRPSPNPLPPLRPVPVAAAPFWGRLIWALIAILLIAGIFFIGWSSAHRRARNLVAGFDPVTATQDLAQVPVPAPVPVPDPVPVVPAPVSAPAPVVVPPPPMPVLQGIFFSPAAPTAIVNGKTVHPGSQLGQYLVKEISQSTVTLVGPDQKEIRLGLNH